MIERNVSHSDIKEEGFSPKQKLFLNIFLGTATVVGIGLGVFFIKLKDGKGNEKEEINEVKINEVIDSLGIEQQMREDFIDHNKGDVYQFVIDDVKEKINEIGDQIKLNEKKLH